MQETDVKMKVSKYLNENLGSFLLNTILRLISGFYFALFARIKIMIFVYFYGIKNLTSRR
jgi:hypothetical protein